MKKCAAEFLGTFGLVFAGTGAIIINGTSGGTITHVGIALTFGLIVLAMIYTFGDVSGAHINPAVTTAFAVAGRFSWKEVPGYIAAQLLGAFSASGLLRLLFLTDKNPGSTFPSGSDSQSFILETVLTFFFDARDFERVHRSEGKGHYRGNRDRCCNCIRGDVCRADLRGLDEPGLIHCACHSERSNPNSLDLYCCTRARGGLGCSCVLCI